MINDLSRFNRIELYNNNNNNFEIIGRYLRVYARLLIQSWSVIRHGAGEGNWTDTRNNNHKLFNQITEDVDDVNIRT